MTDTVYSDAEAVLYEFGWTTGRFGNDVDGYCLLGAVSKAMRYRRPSVLTILDVETAIAKHLGLPLTDIVVWNDRLARGKEDVLNLLQEMHEKELAERGLLHAQTQPQGQEEPFRRGEAEKP